MKRNKSLMAILLFAAFLFSGCVPLVVGGAAVGASTGTYLFVNGELKTDYYYSFDKVWSACEKTVADMRGIEVVPDKEIAQGKISTIINDEKVQFDIKYKAKDLTTVAVRVGIIGNKLSSQLLHDKIAEHLVKNQ
ncbi:MAG TPA: DUF3568 family protein [Smithellaceae bacterium]|nr:DUF3568 family protein [Smithellaceae bacterium]